MKLIRAWHAFLDDEGDQTSRGGQRLTVGIDQQGRIWLSGDAINGQDVPISPDTAAWLSGALTAAIPRAPDDAGKHDDCDRDRAAAWLEGSAGDRTLSVPGLEHQAAELERPAALPFATVPRLRRIRRPEIPDEDDRSVL